jgi:hypothetical protein
MKQNFFKRRKIFKTTDPMLLTPITLVEHESAGDQLISLKIPRFKNKPMNVLVPPKKTPYIYIKFDEIGTFTWLQTDGKRNIGQIAELLKQHFEEKMESAEQRATLFFSRLYQEGYITFKEIEK